MTAKVIDINCITRLNLPPDRVLEAAKDKLEGVVVIGYRKGEEGRTDGEYFASSYADGGDVLWLLERAKHKLLGMVDDD